MNTASGLFWTCSLSLASDLEAALPDISQECDQLECVDEVYDGSRSSDDGDLRQDFIAGRLFERAVARFAADTTALEQMAGNILARKGKVRPPEMQQLAAYVAPSIADVRDEAGSDGPCLQCAPKNDQSESIQEAIRILHKDLFSGEVTGREKHNAYMRLCSSYDPAKVLEAVEEEFDRRTEELPSELIRALGYARSRAAINFLLRVLKEGGENNRYSAAWTLGRYREAADRAFMLRPLLEIGQHLHAEGHGSKYPTEMNSPAWIGVIDLLERYDMAEVFPFISEFSASYQQCVLNLVLLGRSASYRKRELEQILARPDVFEYLLFHVEASQIGDKYHNHFVGKTLPDVLLKRIVQTDFKQRAAILWKALGATSGGPPLVAMDVLNAYARIDHRNTRSIVIGLASALKSGTVSFPVVMQACDRLGKSMSLMYLEMLALHKDPALAGVTTRCLVASGGAKNLARVVNEWIRSDRWDRAFDAINIATAFVARDDAGTWNPQPSELDLFVSVIERALESDDPKARSSALALLCRVDPLRGSLSLLSAKNDPDANVRRRAEALLSSMPKSIDESPDRGAESDDVFGVG